MPVENPSPKLCECGCGELAPIAQHTNREYGHVNGQPVRFVSGHNSRTRPLAPTKRAKAAETELRRHYLDEHRSAKEIAAQHGVSQATVGRWLRRLGIPMRSRSEWSRLGKSGNLFDDYAAIKMYEGGASTKDIQRTLGASPNTVLAVLRRNGIPTRTKSEAGRLRRNAAKRKAPRPSQLRGIEACAICGDLDALEAHHINADCSDNRPENLMWLCWEHHVFIEYLVGRAVDGIRARQAVACSA